MELPVLLGELPSNHDRVAVLVGIIRQFKEDAGAGNGTPAPPPEGVPEATGNANKKEDRRNEDPPDPGRGTAVLGCTRTRRSLPRGAAAATKVE